MDKKKMTRNYLARATNTRFEVINKWYNKKTPQMSYLRSFLIKLVVGLEPAAVSCF